ncbi:uncharacterized protein LOC124367581 [Homalodisca vitripennis]|uniref:uncharacterized protein LOC124367581 n=1 Tax=Homalodisca vitripennis TaxID=197043 RepID=UPI001EEA1F53|nr:uncharacterized protein LOC124367581 [Homalodisca vitripennis]XP_046680490.1 uncharacterized protein LOC124367581 [Homalodisca vitripennis]XP_046680491.1 uncharacterized protein LOC124367581 [Homalodisca vitripennis]XP_046680492.1 uncharacterized protein LOC124367581 [Homalodisca vitripennis]KAG8293812.1 hypothetical protein J6590_010804 [Homalodisca vitripennis]
MKRFLVIFLFGLVVVRGGVLLGGEEDTDASDEENLKQIKQMFQQTMQDAVTDEDGYETKVTLKDLECKRQVVAGTRYNCESKVNYETVCKKPSSECEEKPKRSSSCKASFWLPLGEDAKLQYTDDGKPSCVA